MIDNICFSFSSCILLYPYLLGVAKQLYDTFRDDLKNYTFCGCSYGSIVCALLALDIDPEFFFFKMMEYQQILNPLKIFEIVLEDINLKNELLIEKINNRCQITVTQLPFFRQINIYQYKNLRELNEWLSVACTDIISGKFIPTEKDSKLYINSCYSCIQSKWHNNLKKNIFINLIDKNKSEIYPSNSINFINKDNYDLYNLGIKDTVKWLESNKIKYSKK